ncbi:hypothetical protein GGS26DRAFT_602364 [Hypomontagnella submonticulosa]|nr:hypothetical protein GGS26DRAFT_602364 [Hypomontagnella submonticulosa]
MAPTLEALPLVVLDRICEYLQGSNHKWRGLEAFSLASKFCSYVAQKQRFSQVLLVVDSLDKLRNDLKLLHEVLGVGNRLFYVRRFKISTKPRREECTSAEEEERSITSRTSIRELDFDMDKFCRPRKTLRMPKKTNAMRNPASVGTCHQLLADFMSQLLNLQDLVWDCAVRLPPPCILSAVNVIGCRLHVHGFRLDTLIRNQDRIGFIDPDDFAVATSPHLYSIAVPVHDDNTDWDNGIDMIINDPKKEAVFHMMTGEAPNLAHIWMMPCLADYSDKELRQDRTDLGDAPQIDPSRFEFFREIPSKGNTIQGSIRSLAFDFGIFAKYMRINFAEWSRHTDFTKLRCLTITWQWDFSDEKYTKKLLRPLLKMAKTGTFESLRSLTLNLPTEGHPETQMALITLLQRLSPLEALHLHGPLSRGAFVTAISRHGVKLRKLRVHPSPSYRFNDSRYDDANLVLSEDVVLLLAKKCPKLEEIELIVRRTGGDNKETGIYRALSRLPRLTHVNLELESLVGSALDKEKARRGDRQFTPRRNSTIPPNDIREGLIDCAVDAALALQIFVLISTNNSLRYLALRSKCSFMEYHRNVQDICNWVGRSWVCEKDNYGNVSTRELLVRSRHQLRENLENLEDESCLAVWDSLWPQKTVDRWENWESFPLSESPA